MVIHIGVLTPHAAAGPEVEFAEMAPGRVSTEVVRIPAVAKPGPETPESARALTAPPVLEEAAGRFSGPVDVVGFASTSSAYAIGLAEESATVARLSERLGVPVASTSASAISAARALGVSRIALVSPPWFDEQAHRLGAAYFSDNGFSVVASGSADLPNDPALITPAAVVEWTSRHVSDEADAVWMGGNGFRVAGAVDALEERLGRPVLTANQVLLWALATGLGITGYGRLFALP